MSFTSIQGRDIFKEKKKLTLQQLHESNLYDIILIRDDLIEMDRLKRSLAIEFKIKDLGSLKYFLGMEILEVSWSTTGYCTFVWGNLVTWRSKKQNIVARSSVEIEFRAMSHGICEML
uniref:Reverse transcriptase Ty1/copia-type domain-containing protein n=1 Tax=Vitis vinifera TaxID=29760 RepID=A5B794_VITVI|nr:hypothetical protein VITISV_032935 [Vitis vinifera]